MSGNSDDAALQEEELEVVKAIYGDDVQVSQETLDGARVVAVTVRADGRRPLTVRLVLPSGYPSSCAPLFEIVSDWATSEPAHAVCIATGLDDMAAQATGEVVLFRWIEWLREYVADKSPLLDAAKAGARSQAPAASALEDAAVYDEDGDDDYDLDGVAEGASGARAVDYTSFADEYV
eukprot:Opistho-1_new@11316